MPFGALADRANEGRGVSGMSPQRSAALVEAGVFLQLSGDAAGAKVLFRQALALDPANKKAKVLLGDEHPLVRADPQTTLPEPVELPREAAGNETFFVALTPPQRSAADVTMVGRPIFPTERPHTPGAMLLPAAQNFGLGDRGLIAGHLADGAFDKALGVALERLRVDADDVEAHELAWDILVAAGQTELARSQLGNLVEVAVLKADVSRVRRFVHELEHQDPAHPVLPQARALVSESRVAETDATLIDEALRSVL